MIDLQTDSKEGIEAVVNVILAMVKEGFSVILFSGELGSGKTTLVQELCHALGVDQNVTSPTFSIIQQYISGEGEPIYHMDLYRLERSEELVQIGFQEYLDSGHLCLIEWPEIGTTYFMMPFIRVEINVENNNIRNFKITTHDAVDA